MTSRLVPILASASSTSDPCSSLADVVLTLLALLVWYKSNAIVQILTLRTHIYSGAPPSVELTPPFPAPPSPHACYLLLPNSAAVASGSARASGEYGGGSGRQCDVALQVSVDDFQSRPDASHSVYLLY